MTEPLYDEEWISRDKDGSPIPSTHLVDWLKHGYTHCKHGLEQWCNGYLLNAANIIPALMEENRQLREAYKELARVSGAYADELETQLEGRTVER